MLAAGGDQVMEHRDPVAVVGIESVPERPHPRAPSEIGEECRLAIPGVGEDEDDAAVDLGAQPVQQAWSFQRLVAERWTLDLRVLDRVAADLVAQVGTPGRRHPGHIVRVPTGIC